MSASEWVPEGEKAQDTLTEGWDGYRSAVGQRTRARCMVRRRSCLRDHRDLIDYSWLRLEGAQIFVCSHGKMTRSVGRADIELSLGTEGERAPARTTHKLRPVLQ